MNGVPVKNSKPAVGVTADRSPKADITKGQLKGGAAPGASGAAGKEGQMQRTDTTVPNKVAATQGAQPNKGEMKVGPQDSTTVLAEKKKKKSPAETLYPNFPLKE